MQEHNIEEVLEHIWTTEEEEHTKFGKEKIVNWVTPESVEDVLKEMLRADYVFIEDSNIRLTTEGKKVATLIVRRHRLAERLLNDILEVKADTVASSACDFEHFLNEEVTTSICTLLGHPVDCPHGKAIPPGDCCAKDRKVLKPLVMTLSELRSGDEVKIAYITTRHHSRLDRLSSLGLMPGVNLRVHQKQPSIVIQMGETQIALDNDVARDIYVRLSHHP
ncbi:MAG: metal-dependent transcriptional regulator [Candidatus Brocadiales bacterium]